MNHDIKNDGEKIISRWHNVSIKLCSILLKSVTQQSFKHRILKNMHNLIMTERTSLENECNNTFGSNSCIKTWQSWLFNCKILHYFKSIHLEIFDEYPSGTLRSFNIFNITFFSCRDRVTSSRQFKLVTNFNRMKFFPDIQHLQIQTRV